MSALAVTFGIIAHITHAYRTVGVAALIVHFSLMPATTIESWSCASVAYAPRAITIRAFVVGSQTLHLLRKTITVYSSFHAKSTNACWTSLIWTLIKHFFVRKFSLLFSLIAYAIKFRVIASPTRAKLAIVINAVWHFFTIVFHFSHLQYNLVSSHSEQKHHEQLLLKQGRDDICQNVSSLFRTITDIFNLKAFWTDSTVWVGRFITTWIVGH